METLAATDIEGAKRYLPGYPLREAIHALRESDEVEINYWTHRPNNPEAGFFDPIVVAEKMRRLQARSDRLTQWLRAN